MTDLIMARLDAIRCRADKVTEGPWEHHMVVPGTVRQRGDSPTPPRESIDATLTTGL